MTTHWKRNSSLCLLFSLTAAIFIVLFIADLNHSDYVKKQNVLPIQATHDIETLIDGNETGNIL